MNDRVLALFPGRAPARAAIDALRTAGIPASAIAVAELRPGVGVVFGTASVTSPGDDDPFEWPGPYGNILGSAISGAFNPTLVQEYDPEELAQAFIDFGLPDDQARACAQALAAGATFLAVDLENTGKTPESIQTLLRPHGAFSPTPE